MIKKARVEGGFVVGTPAADPRIISYKGIPFAAPPVGENRWRAPQPVIPWDGEKECYIFKPISMQHTPGLDKNNLYSREWNVDPTIPMSEDCLYLNVWTPAESVDEKLPVMVWYFGGGLQEGNPSEMEFDGERLARRGIIVVTVNYRLNIFGFLAHPDLTKENPDAPTNFGHLDQQAGIKWVKSNIAAFGGDPENITIGGQSAGGASVSMQVTSPQNVGLFQKAMIISGINTGVYPSPFDPKPLEEAEKKGADYLRDVLGVESIEEARKLDSFFIRDKLVEHHLYFGSTLDNKFAFKVQEKSYVQGTYMHIPMLITRTDSELFMGQNSKDLVDFESEARKNFGKYADEFLEICKADSIEEANEKSKLFGIEIGLRAIEKTNKKTENQNPIYYGVFAPSIPGWDNPKTFHSSDLWFWFETLAKCWRPFKGFHYDLARQMCNYMAYFVKYGNPNGKDADGTMMPQWEEFTADKPFAMWLKDSGPELHVETLTPITEVVLKAFLDNNKQ